VKRNDPIHERFREFIRHEERKELLFRAIDKEMRRLAAPYRWCSTGTLAKLIGFPEKLLDKVLTEIGWEKASAGTLYITRAGRTRGVSKWRPGFNIPAK
jgi:hypothetical protein